MSATGVGRSDEEDHARDFCMITCRTPIRGNGREEKPLFAGPESPAIAHDGFTASAGFGAFDASQRDFPMNRAPPRWKFVCRPKRKSARLAKWRASSHDNAAHRFHLKQQRSNDREVSSSS
jgi:hypothetical protein